MSCWSWTYCYLETVISTITSLPTSTFICIWLTYQSDQCYWNMTFVDFVWWMWKSCVIDINFKLLSSPIYILWCLHMCAFRSLNGITSHMKGTFISKIFTWGVIYIVTLFYVWSDCLLKKHQPSCFIHRRYFVLHEHLTVFEWETAPVPHYIIDIVTECHS